MKTNTQTHPHRISVRILITALALVAGCGDAHVFSLDPGHIPPGSKADELACFDGAEVRLSRYSSRCDRSSVIKLLTEVGVGTEFPAEQVRTLDSPCSDGPSPGIEIHLDHTSLIFDFSDLAEPGRFPRADFEGFVIDFAANEQSSLLLAASVDEGGSSIGLDNADVFYDSDRIEVNFQGVSYDDEDFVKIDLWFAAAVRLGGEQP